MYFPPHFSSLTDKNPSMLESRLGLGIELRYYFGSGRDKSIAHSVETLHELKAGSKYNTHYHVYFSSYTHSDLKLH